jgi:ABC-type transport system involved in cytochrome c biogenesis permease component
VFFLPIVDRELRVAARKQSTFWIRAGSACLALLFVILIPINGMSSAASATLGLRVFTTLTWLSAVCAMVAGLLFTADCVSEEKREGTLGFLFLTDLRGYDVVLGKLLANSVRSFFALLAIFPILAVSLLLGGVAGAQLWKTMLALVNMLFVSLTIGIYVSTRSRDAQVAMFGTVGLLVLFGVAGQGVDMVLAHWRARAFQPVFSFISPMYAFTSASRGSAMSFWVSLLISHAAAWIMLCTSCAVLPHLWQQKATNKTLAAEQRGQRWKFGGARARLSLRRRLRNKNPLIWLASRESGQTLVMWIVVLALAVFYGSTARLGQTTIWASWHYPPSVLSLLLYLAVASQAARFFVEGKRNGLLEQLLSTRLTTEQIVTGYWRGAIRTFAAPAIAFALVLGISTGFAQYTTQMQRARMSGRRANAPAGVVIASNPTTNGNIIVLPRPTNMVLTTPVPALKAPVTARASSAHDLWINAVAAAVVSSAAHVCTILANMAALCWFGMWTGLCSRKANIASVRTIAFAQVIPWFVITFVSGMATLVFSRVGGASDSWMILFVSLIPATLFVAKDVAFIMCSRDRLLRNFRNLVLAGGFVQVVPPPLPSQQEWPYE